MRDAQRAACLMCVSRTSASFLAQTTAAIRIGIEPSFRSNSFARGFATTVPDPRRL